MRPLEQFSPYANTPADFHSLVELYDAYANPLLLIPRNRLSKSKLSRRMVQLCLRDPKKRIFLRRRSQHMARHPNLWDISLSIHVMAGESLEGAALRGLEQELGLSGIRIRSVASLPYRDSLGASILAALFLAGPSSTLPRPNPKSASDSMFLSEAELRGLTEQEPDMFTPEIVWAVRSAWIFA